MTSKVCRRTERVNDFMKMSISLSVRGFVKLKNPKIREKLGSGWVGQAPTRIINFLEMLCVLCFLFCVHMLLKVSKKKKKLDRGVGGWGLINPSFSRIFGFF